MKEREKYIYIHIHDALSSSNRKSGSKVIDLHPQKKYADISHQIEGNMQQKRYVSYCLLIIMFHFNYLSNQFDYVQSSQPKPTIGIPSV